MTGPTAADRSSAGHHAEDGTERAEKIRRAEAHEGPECRARGEDRLREIGLRGEVILGQAGPLLLRSKTGRPRRHSPRHCAWLTARALFACLSLR
jgi:hypothetical protein